MTDREDFELKISMEYEQPPCLDRDGEGYDNSYVDNAWWGWQAARAIDAKRIAELEAWANRPVTDNTQLIANMEAQITDLESEIAKLNAIIEDMKVVDNVFSK